MRVTLKMKHVVLSIALIVLFAGVFITFFHPMLDQRMINQYIASGSVSQAKEALLEKIEKGSRNQLDLIREYMIEPQPWGERYDVYISPSLTSFSSVNSNRLFTIEESEKYLQIYIEKAPADGYLRRAVELLYTFYKRTGQFNEAEATVDQGLSRFPESHYDYHELKLKKIELAIDSQNYDRADRFINEFEPEVNGKFTDVFLQLSKFTAELLIQQGEYDKAYHYLIEEIKKHEDWHNELISDISDDEPDFYDDGMTGSPYFQALVKLRAQLELVKDDEQLAVVEGKVVRSNGEPVPNVGVFLRDQQQVNRTVSDTDRQVVTGQDGSFSFIGVIPGSYQIKVGFMFEQIDGWSWPVEHHEWIDVNAGEMVNYPIVISPLIETISPVGDEVIQAEEVTFKWEPVDGAQSYELTGHIYVDNGSIGVPIISGVKTNEITLPVEHLYNVTTGTMFRDDDLEKKVEPATILGFANTEATFSWSVKAFDKMGKSIAQSNGYRLREETMGPIPFFQLKERELTKVDQAFLHGDGNVKKALAMYVENLEKNEEDIHSLRMVTRLIGITADNEELLSYWIRLAEKSNYPDHIFEVFRLHYVNGNWDEIDNWYNRYEESLDGAVPDYPKAIYAESLMKRGKLEEARKLFYEVMEVDNWNRFIGSLLAIELYLQNDWDIVEQLALQFPERSHEATNWHRLIQQLRKDVSIEDVKVALKAYFTENEDDFADFLKRIDQPSLKQFIDRVANVR